MGRKRSYAKLIMRLVYLWRLAGGAGVEWAGVRQGTMVVYRTDGWLWKCGEGASEQYTQYMQYTWQYIAGVE